MTDILASKVCTKCKHDKPLEEFQNRKGAKDGKRADCRSCVSARAKRYREANKSKVAEEKRKYYLENRESIRKRQASKYKQKISDPAALEKIRAYRRNDYKKNKEAYLARASASQRRNKEQRAEYLKNYVAENRDTINARLLERYRRLYKKDAGFTCSVAARNFLRRCTQEAMGIPQVREYRSVLGYGPEELKARLECQFSPGMSWDNYGEWHIDHKLPISWFTRKGETRLHIINALSNLQPMWAHQNRSKGARWAG